MNLRPKFITDNEGNKLYAVLPIKHYQKLLESLEELEDIFLYDEACKNTDGNYITLTDYLNKLKAGKL